MKVESIKIAKKKSIFFVYLWILAVDALTETSHIEVTETTHP